MNYITLTLDNIDHEHICCALSNNKDIQVISKKNWLKERIKDGLVFVKADFKGKCFIEYIPSEYSFAPIDANNYMYIDCFWVSGSHKGKGYSNDLLDICINDAQNSPSAWCTFALFYNGKFITHEILSSNKMQKIIDSLKD